MAATEEIFIGRQPILDRQQQLFAYELLFRSGRKNEANVQNDLAASASVISHAFADLGVDQALGPYRGFLNCDEALLLSDSLEILPPEKIVLEVLETVDITPPVIERCRELKARGFTLALDDFVRFENRYKPILDMIEIVKVDLVPLDQATLGETTRALQRWPLQLLAEKVDNREQARFCHDLGYAYFQGYYFARPVVLAGRKLGHSQLSLIQLLGLVLEDAETHVIEAVFKKESGLAMNLMRLTNSVATGAPVKITSLSQALTVLGRRQLQRWLQLLLYTSPGSSQLASPLLQLAATRGRLMELLATKLHPGRRDVEDRAFMTGIMSLMPALMSTPMEEVLKGIDVGIDVRTALESGEGELGVMLVLAEALESGNGALCHDLVDRLPGVDHMTVNSCLAQALSWASSIGRSNE
jgi:c-di-GMP-related signal transduction protein